MRCLYPDTSAWNRFADQAVEPGALIRFLRDRGFHIAIGFNVFYEIGKLFHRGTEGDTARGPALMTYMRQYLELGVPLIKGNWALLSEEALDVCRDAPMKSCFGDDEQYRKVYREIERLIQTGVFEPEGLKFFEGRKSLARVSRAVVRNGLRSRPEHEAYLNAVSESRLPSFLADASAGPAGQSLLAQHLLHEFPKNAIEELRWVARSLLSFRRYRVSRALTRTDLYLNWRCAKRGSIRGDLPDDAFHVISAAYSDVFLTTEGDQANIARYAIEGIRALVCKANEPVLGHLAQELGT